MSHLDDGRLRALMDEELGDADADAVRLHLEDCDACRHRMVELEGRATLVAVALGHLDTAAPPAGARAAVLERIGSSPREERVGPTRPVASVEHAESKSRAGALRTPLARAAILVLFLGGGVVTALPAEGSRPRAALPRGCDSMPPARKSRSCCVGSGPAPRSWSVWFQVERPVPSQTTRPPSEPPRDVSR